ncbi:MAG: dephospho-CoA kinase [bacterium]|nr:dephospho-CoA kinase [Candidatus Colisoma equi]
MRIALTGGIACGKSLVAKFLNELGVETIDADDIVHELIPDPAERKRIAAEIFGNEAKRKELEARLHPLVKERIEEFFGEVKSKSEKVKSEEGHTFSFFLFPFSFKIAIIPLLFEAHWEGNFDIICCVRSERDLQISRMMAMRGYTREEAEARLAAQLPVDEKAAKSHYVIDNNGSPHELKLQVAEFVNWLKEREDR